MCVCVGDEGDEGDVHPIPYGPSLLKNRERVSRQEGGRMVAFVIRRPWPHWAIVWLAFVEVLMSGW